jgi:hypothetical protein
VANQTLTIFCRKATTLAFGCEKKADQDTLEIWGKCGLEALQKYLTITVAMA